MSKSITFERPPRTPLSPLTRAVISLGLLVAYPLVLRSSPLLGMLGYEFCAGLALLVGLLGVWFGGATEPSRSFRAASLLSLLLVVPLAIVWFGHPGSRKCDPHTGLIFFGLLPMISVWSGVATGQFVRHKLRRGLWAGFVLVALSLLWGVWRMYRTPAVFGFDPYLGYFPGVLYDESIPIPASLLYARGMHLALSIGVLLWIARRRILALPLVAAGLIVFSLRGSLGIAPGGDDIVKALGAVRELGPLRMVYSPSALRGDALEAAASDHLFRYEQVARQTGLRPYLTSFVFPSAEEKKRWTGAGRTFIAKPWRNEIYIHQEDFPHPVLKHELLHAFLNAWGSRPLGIPWTMTSLPIGLVEGFAVALDGGRRGGPYSLDDLARALRQLSLLPDVEGLMGVAFYRFPVSRAYPAAGSFIQFLDAKFGREKLAQLYQRGAFEAVYGQNLRSLEALWIAHLDEKKLDAAAIDAVADQLSRPAIWHRVCAHALADLDKQWRAAWGRGDFATAETCLETAAQQDPDDPRHAIALVEVRLSAGQLAPAEQALAAARKHPKQSPPQKGRIDELAGDLAWARGDFAGAQAAWKTAASRFHPAYDADVLRLLQLKIVTATSDDSERNLLGDYLFRRSGGGRADASRSIYFAGRIIAANPESGLGHYLLGRNLIAQGLASEGRGELDLGRQKGLPDELFVDEAERLAAVSAFEAGDYEQAGRRFAEWRMRLVSPSENGRANQGPIVASIDDWLERARFQAERQAKHGAPKK